MRRRLLFIVAVGALALPACSVRGGVSPSGWGTLAPLPGGAQGSTSGTTTSTTPRSFGARVVAVDLGSTSQTAMFIHLSSNAAPAGKVTFVIHNSSSSMDHELVGFTTKTPAGDYPITSFEGQANRIDEDKAGQAVIDTGAALKPGATKLLTVDLKAGHVALVCNLPGHYRAGMHADLWVYPAGATLLSATLGDTSATSMFIKTSTDAVPAGKVAVLITNSSSSMDHELVGFATKTPAGDYPITSFEGQANRIDEDKAGQAVIDTGAALKPGATKLLTVDLKAGHVALVCNLPGHYRAGMHADLWAY